MYYILYIIKIYYICTYVHIYLIYNIYICVYIYIYIYILHQAVTAMKSNLH